MRSESRKWIWQSYRITKSNLDSVTESRNYGVGFGRSHGGDWGGDMEAEISHDQWTNFRLYINIHINI